jgi:purine-nucleoside phosphorylase
MMMGMDMPDPMAAARRLTDSVPLRPTLAMVLGSGFQHTLTELKVAGQTPYAQIPGFPTPTIDGHAGEVFWGTLADTPVLVLSGRTHYYEGQAMARVTFAMRALAEFGIKDVLLTNAAGGINRKFQPGDFMVITDHLNFMGVNPLRGPNPPGRARFLDLTAAYDPELRAQLQAAGRAAGLKLQTGVYLAVSGPSYETPAEIRAFASWGADAVGMSTVPEVIVARHCRLRVAAVSCITNAAAGLGTTAVSHTEVLDTAERVKTGAARLLHAFARGYGQAAPAAK